MGRPRKNKADNWMPPRVSRGKSAFELYPKGGGCIRLCGLDASEEEVWAAYNSIKQKVKILIGDLAKGYFTSRNYLRKAPRTQRDYRNYWDKSLAAVFQEADAVRTLPKHIRKWMDLRATHGGETIANREKALLSNLYRWGMEYLSLKDNPCRHVTDFPEPGRADFYIEDEDLDGIHGYYWVLERSRPIVQAFMELSYLPGSRGQDVRKITLKDLRENGIFIKQGKTGKKQIKEWTPRLHDAVNVALRIREGILENLKNKKGINVLSPYLLITRTGQPYTEDGLKTIWAKNKKAIEANINWTFHDIKAKGISDFEGDIGQKQTFSGHKTRGQVERYNRKPEMVATLDTDSRPLRKLYYGKTPEKS